MYYDDIDFYAINKGQSDTKIEIHSVINRWKNETNGQKKILSNNILNMDGRTNPSFRFKTFTTLLAY